MNKALSIRLAVGVGLGIPNLVPAVLFFKAIPRFEQMFMELAIELPQLTQWVISIGAVPIACILGFMSLWPPIYLLVKRDATNLDSYLIIASGIVSLMLTSVVCIAMFNPLLVIMEQLS